MMQGPSFRIIKQIKAMLANPVDGITFEQDYDNYRHFFATIQGPPNTCYTGGKFALQINFPSEYPIAAPKIAFSTKIYHPNIDQLGRLKLDILDVNWTPIIQIRDILTTIRQLLINPNLDSPSNYNLAKHWLTEPQSAYERARQYTAKYAQ